MVKRPAAVFAVALWGLVPVSGAYALPTEEAVVFNGRLDASAAADLIARLQNASTLHITSQGGDEAAALELGRIVVERRIRVVVDDYCMSACANLVFAVSPQPEVGHQAIVGFHTSAIAIEQKYQARREPPSTQVSELASGYRALYQAAGIRTALLECAAEQIGLTDQRIVDVDPSTGMTRTGWKSLRTWWVPSMADLRAFGIPAINDVNQDERWRSSVRQRLRARNPQAIRFGLAENEHGTCSTAG